MYSLKHVEDDKSEKIVEAVSISFDPKKNELIGYGSPNVDNGIIRFNSGHVYVMNERGSTVGVYSLRMK